MSIVKGVTQRVAVPREYLPSRFRRRGYVAPEYFDVLPDTHTHCAEGNIIIDVTQWSVGWEYGNNKRGWFVPIKICEEARHIIEEVPI